MRPLVLILCLFGTFFTSNAQALVYKPVNPAFGGDTFNYPWLLSSAEAQSFFKEDPKTGTGQKTQLQQFTENLNGQLLNQISNSLFQKQIGGGIGGGVGSGTTGSGISSGSGTSSGGIQTGTYVFGSLSVDVYPSNLGVVVDILDTKTGEQTQVIVPGNN